MINPERITVIAEKKLRLDGLILNNGLSHGFELFPVDNKDLKSINFWQPVCKFNSSIKFQLGKSFERKYSSKIYKIKGNDYVKSEQLPGDQFAKRARLSSDVPQRMIKGSQISLTSNMGLPMNEINEVASELEDQSTK